MIYWFSCHLKYLLLFNFAHSFTVSELLSQTPKFRAGDSKLYATYSEKLSLDVTSIFRTTPIYRTNPMVKFTLAIESYLFSLITIGVHSTLQCGCVNVFSSFITVHILEFLCTTRHSEHSNCELWTHVATDLSFFMFFCMRSSITGVQRPLLALLYNCITLTANIIIYSMHEISIGGLHSFKQCSVPLFLY